MSHYDSRIMAGRHHEARSKNHITKRGKERGAMGLFGRLPTRKKQRIFVPIVWESTPSQPPRVYTDAEGRRRRGDAPYLLPKDASELQRLDYQHFI